MTGEWKRELIAALVGALPGMLTALVGVAGIIGGVLIANGRNRHESQQRQAESVEAHARWHRERRADAYVELLQMAETVGVVVVASYPLFDTGQPTPKPPGIDEQHRVTALVGAFGTREVKQVMESWKDIAHSGFRAIEAVSRGDEDARLTLHEIRSQEIAARKALADAIAQELAPVDLQATPIPRPRQPEPTPVESVPE
jgi:hypothetical protein